MKMKMNVNVKESTLIRPAEETPNRSLWVSDIDLVHIRVHMSTVHFYKPVFRTGYSHDGAIEVTRLLKESLSKVLVPFYPVAGRLGRNEKGRVEVECNGKGVLFLLAETDSAMDEFGNGEFAPNEELRQLVQTVDYSNDISSYPLALIQVTFFKCGGISLGVALHHTLFDGQSAMNFINSWARTARGLPIEPAFHDRTLLHSRALPSPKFSHPEYDSPSVVLNTKNFRTMPKSTSICHLKISLDQLNTLKHNANTNGTKFSSYVVLSAHIWRCTSLARGLADDQTTRLYMAIDGRSRLNPPLPKNFCGNVVFPAVAIASARDILRESLSCTAERIHRTIKKIDDEYLRSALAYLQHNPEAVECRQGNFIFRSPNHNIVSWSRISMNDADFGWGLPDYVGPAVIHSEGKGYITSSASNDGGLGFALSLETDHVEVFEKIFYEF